MKKIREMLLVIRRHWFAVSLVMLVGSFGVAIAMTKLPKTYEAKSHVLIVAQSAGRDPSVSMVDLPIVASSTVVLSRVIDRLHLTVPLIRLQRAIKAKVGGLRSSIMEIIYRDDDPDRAVAVPNAVAEELTRYYEQISTASENETIRKIDIEIGQVQQRLKKINRELAAQSAGVPFLESDKALDTLTTRIDDLDLQRELARATLSSDIASAAALEGDARHLSDVARHEMLLNDPLYRDLSDAAARDGAELTADDAIHTAYHPDHIALAPKVSHERAAAEAEARRFLRSPDALSPSREQNEQQLRRARALIEGDRAKIAALDTILSAEQARLRQVPQNSVTDAWLRLQRDAAQADYLALKGQRNTAVASRAEALSLGSVVVVDRAIRADTATVGMGRMQLGVAGFSIVLILALGSAFLIEKLDPSLRRAEQIENLYGAPLLTTIIGNER